MTTILAVLAAALAAVADPPAAVTSPPAGVEAVVVTSRAPVVGDLQKGVLDYRPEFFLPVRPASALDMVNWLPGFVFEDTRDMRGLEGSTGNVLIDGKPPTSKTDTLQSVLRRIPSNQVERIDLIVGGAPGIDMHGRSVIANVVLKAGSALKGQVALSNYLDTHGLASPDLLITLSRKYDGKEVQGALELDRQIGIYPNFGYGPWVRRDGDGAVLLTADTAFKVGGPGIMGSASYEAPAGAGRLRGNALGRYYSTDLAETDELKPGPGEYSFHDRQDYGLGELGLHYELPIGRATLETQALERLTHTTFDYLTQRPPLPSTFSQAGDEWESVVSATLRFKHDDTLTIESSAEGALNTASTQSGSTLDGTPQFIAAAKVDIAEWRGEAGGSLNWKPNARYGLDASLKVEASDLSANADVHIERRYAYLKPRLVFTWSPAKDRQFRLRGEHEVTQVAFMNFASFSEYNSGQIRAGNPNLLPQRAWVAEALAEQGFWTGGDLTLTLRRRWLKDVIDVATAVGPAGLYGLNSNIGDGRGTDLVINLTVPLKPLGLGGAILRGAVTWSHQRVPDPVDGRPRPISNQAEPMAELHLAQDLPRWTLNWGMDAFYRGPSTLYRPFGNEAVAGWPHVNVFVEYRIRPTLNLRVELQNLPGTHVRQTIDVFSGLRGASPLVYRDEKRLSVGPLLFVRLRRTFE